MRCTQQKNQLRHQRDCCSRLHCFRLAGVTLILLREKFASTAMRPVVKIQWQTVIKDTLLSRIITETIAYNATYRYCIYSPVDFSVCRHAGTTRCTKQTKFGTKKRTMLYSLIRVKFHHYRWRNVKILGNLWNLFAPYGRISLCVEWVSRSFQFSATSLVKYSKLQ